MQALTQSSFVIFQSGDSAPKAAPLELISRIEEINTDKIELHNGHPVIKYRGELMNLASIDPAYIFPSIGTLDILIINDNNLYMGLIVDSVIDIIKTPAQPETISGHAGIVGNITIDNKSYNLVDIFYYFNKASKNYQKSLTKENPQLNKKILFIENSPFFRKFIPPELESSGYMVTTVANNKDALQELGKDTNYAAIITDMNMPEMNGKEFAYSCKQNNKLKNIPIIALSSSRNTVENFNNQEPADIDYIILKTNYPALIKALNQLI
jgi:two-component system, chemotaxis family, sensor kinase CheA